MSNANTKQAIVVRISSERYASHHFAKHLDMKDYTFEKQSSTYVGAATYSKQSINKTRAISKRTSNERKCSRSRPPCQKLDFSGNCHIVLRILLRFRSVRHSDVTAREGDALTTSARDRSTRRRHPRRRSNHRPSSFSAIALVSRNENNQLGFDTNVNRTKRNASKRVPFSSTSIAVVKIRIFFGANRSASRVVTVFDDSTMKV